MSELPLTAPLIVAFKALVLRAGGRVEISADELAVAERFVAHVVDADAEVMVVELAVEGDA